ncbi:MAG TPA: ribonuclease P protein component [Chitinophagaceae bacterium]|nr:ribonuclease P protein component [Chitinophagaceae bacterium]
MSKQFTLGKEERLKSRKQIEKLFAEGKSFAVIPFRIYFLVHGLWTMNHGLQFGVGVSAKNFKRAVDRNRIKRLTREAWRLQKNELSEKVKTTQKQLNVFLIYTGKELPDFTTVRDKVTVVLKKLADKIDENISSYS